MSEREGTSSDVTLYDAARRDTTRHDIASFDIGGLDIPAEFSASHDVFLQLKESRDNLFK
jgi:hypothetical protein